MFTALQIATQLRTYADQIEALEEDVSDTGIELDVLEQAMEDVSSALDQTKEEIAAAKEGGDEDEEENEEETDEEK